MSIRVRVRLFAVQRELAGTREVPLELADGADVEAAWSALVETPPGPRPGPGLAPLRPQRRLRGADHDSRRWRRGGDDPARVRWRRTEAPARMRPTPRARTGSSRSARRRSRPPSWPSWRMRSRSPRTARSSGSSAGPARRPGTPAPGQEAEAARHAGRQVESLEYEAHDTMALRTLATIADEIAAAVRRRPPGDRPSLRRGAPRRGVDRGGRRRARTATRHSTRPATPSTRPRRGPRSGRPSGSPTGTSGSATRRGPGRIPAHDRRVTAA